MEYLTNLENALLEEPATQPVSAHVHNVLVTELLARLSETRQALAASVLRETGSRMTLAQEMTQ